MLNHANMALDAIDLKILRELQTDARLPNLTLAERVGLSPSPCSRRIRILEETGIIEGYRGIISRAAVDQGLTVFAGIRVDRHTQQNAEAFVQTVLAMEEVISCHLVSGDVDFLLEVVARDMAAYETTVLRKLLELPAVRDIRTSFAMRTYRAAGPIPIRTTSRVS